MSYEMSDVERKWVEDRMGDCIEYRGEEMMLVATERQWAFLENAAGETGRVLLRDLMKKEEKR